MDKNDSRCRACDGSGYQGFGRGDGPYGDAPCLYCEGSGRRPIDQYASKPLLWGKHCRGLGCDDFNESVPSCICGCSACTKPRQSTNNHALERCADEVKRLAPNSLRSVVGPKDIDEAKTTLEASLNSSDDGLVRMSPRLARAYVRLLDAARALDTGLRGVATVITLDRAVADLDFILKGGTTMRAEEESSNPAQAGRPDEEASEAGIASPPSDDEGGSSARPLADRPMSAASSPDGGEDLDAEIERLEGKARLVTALVNLDINLILRAAILTEWNRLASAKKDGGE